MPTPLAIFVTLVLSIVTLVGSAPFAQASDPLGNQTPSSSTSFQATVDGLMVKARADGAVPVIIGLKVGFRPEGALSAREAASQQAGIKQAQTDVLQSLTSTHVRNVKQFDYVPYLAMAVDAAGLARLKTHPAVSSVQEDIPEPSTLLESVPLTNTDDAWLTGFTGAGYAGATRRQDIAILDTGVQSTHASFLGKVVSEACYSTTLASQNATTVCPNGQTTQIGAGAGVNCNVAGCDHGTHVAGIAAGADQIRGRYGVARGAGIIAIQVFSRFVDGGGSTRCANAGLASPCVLTYPSDQIAGLNRVFALRTTFSIAAVNMSLGGGQFTSACDTDTRKASIDNLRGAGIATITSSGNSGFTNALGAPACISTAVSVGSTDDGSSGTTVDQVSNFSNSASFLSLLAPGRWISSSVPGAGTYADKSGTSMAAPHVAGAWAILKSVAPEANISVGEVLAALTATGVPVRDTRNNITKPRLRVNEALAMLIPLHPRMMADVNADGRADIVGFNNTGAFVSLSTLGPFTVPQQWEGNFGYLTGGWRAGAYPRLMADVTGDRRADIIGFGHAGVYVARSTGTSFTTLALWNSLYGYSSLSGGWRVDKHPRMLADVNADGRADVVGFGNSGVSVSLSTGTSFTAAQLWVANYGYNQGWRIDQHPRIMADVNGDRRADIVGFGSAGVYVSLSTGTGFTAPALWNNLYGSGSLAGGWRVDRHPRMMADVNGDRRADIVGFGNTGVSVSFSTGTSFTPAQLLVAGFGYNAGGWRVEAHPRTMADVNGDGRADIIGFGNNGVGGALSLGTSFAPPQEWINPGFGYNTQGFRVGWHPRLVADVNADGRADIIGIGNLGVAGSLSFGTGFTLPAMWVNNYGHLQGWR